jgi:hypothetical protein
MVRPSAPPLVDAPQVEGDAVTGWADIKAEQALALIGMGLWRKLAGDVEGGAWRWSGEEGAATGEVSSLRQRLELVDLALRTAAPLTTAEVTHLIGARPGGPVVERGGLLARRRGRNLWILSRVGEEGAGGSGAGTHFQETPRRRF